MPWATLTNPAPAMFSYFGTAVAISGTRVVSGASGAGKAYVYDMASATPAIPVATLSEPGPMVYAGFGSAVSICGDRVVVGAPWTEARAVGAGRVYVFDLASPMTAQPVGILSNPSPSRYDWFGSALATDGSTIVAGAYGDDTVARDRGAAYVFGLPPALRIVPALPGSVTLSWTPATSSGFGLQYSDAFPPIRWFNAPSGATNPVTVPLTNSARCYRLFQP